VQILLTITGEARGSKRVKYAIVESNSVPFYNTFAALPSMPFYIF
jgi:hypothetical protein